MERHRAGLWLWQRQRRGSRPVGWLGVWEWAGSITCNAARTAAPPTHKASLLPAAAWLYKLESGFLEMLLQSGHRTLDPEEAGTGDGEWCICSVGGLLAVLCVTPTRCGVVRRWCCLQALGWPACLPSPPGPCPPASDYFYAPVFTSCFIYPVRDGADSLRDTW